MKIVYFYIILLIFIYTASSQSNVPCHICEYNGISFQPKIEISLSIPDLPKRCEAVSYGTYYLDGINLDDIFMYKSDKIKIKSLVAAKIPVYLYVAYNTTEKWDTEIFEPKDPATYNKLICPLIQTINDLQVTGIILNINTLYKGTDFANKIKALIAKLKQQLPKLKFGLNINAHDYYELLPNNGLFDYSVINSVIDLYFVDMHTHNYLCTPDLSRDGTPITSSDKKVLTLEVLSKAVSQSTIDKSKLIASVFIFPLNPQQFKTYNPYSKYCDNPALAKSGTWCLDKSQRLYDIGAFVKKTFAGVAVDWIEFDDVQGVCQCQKYPATNLIFDGWDGVPMKPCPKIC